MSRALPRRLAWVYALAGVSLACAAPRAPGDRGVYAPTPPPRAGIARLCPIETERALAQSRPLRPASTDPSQRPLFLSSALQRFELVALSLWLTPVYAGGRLNDARRTDDGGADADAAPAEEEVAPREALHFGWSVADGPLPEAVEVPAWDRWDVRVSAITRRRLGGGLFELVGACNTSEQWGTIDPASPLPLTLELAESADGAAPPFVSTSLAPPAIFEGDGGWFGPVDEASARVSPRAAVP